MTGSMRRTSLDLPFSAEDPDGRKSLTTAGAPSGEVLYREIKHCRICGNSDLASVLDLGEQYLTGVFPSLRSPQVGRGPIELVKCAGDAQHACGLVQLR